MPWGYRHHSFLTQALLQRTSSKSQCHTKVNKVERGADVGACCEEWPRVYPGLDKKQRYNVLGTSRKGGTTAYQVTKNRGSCISVWQRCFVRVRDGQLSVQSEVTLTRPSEDHLRVWEKQMCDGNKSWDYVGAHVRLYSSSLLTCETFAPGSF